MPSPYKTVIYEKVGHVVKLTMNRPDRLNAMNAELSSDLREAAQEAQEDDDVRVVLITGAGRAFSSGADLRSGREWWSAAPPPESGETRNVRTPMPASPVPRMLVSIIEKPMIAAVNGVCGGAGMGVALASDVRVASENASFALVYLRRALVPSCEVWFLPRLIGLGPTMYHILKADTIDAQEALRLGLISEVHPADRFDQAAMDLAQDVAERAPVCTKFAKKAIYRGLVEDLESTMEYVGYSRFLTASSGETTRGMRAFLAKEKPVF